MGWCMVWKHRFYVVLRMMESSICRVSTHWVFCVESCVLDWMSLDKVLEWIRE